METSHEAADVYTSPDDEVMVTQSGYMQHRHWSVECKLGYDWVYDCVSPVEEVECILTYDWMVRCKQGCDWLTQIVDSDYIQHNQHRQQDILCLLEVSLTHPTKHNNNSD